jgi:hypothetical protein
MQVMQKGGKGKANRSCEDVSPRKKMAMEGTMGKDVPRKFQMGGAVNMPSTSSEQLDRNLIKRVEAMRSQPMSSGGMRPQMRRNRMV